jgi:hypothetical protein
MPKHFSFNYNGKHYDNVKQFCDEHNINSLCFYNQLKKGKSFQQICDYYMNKQYVYKINNLIFYSKKAACDFYNVKYSTISCYEQRNHLSFEQALKQYLNQSQAFTFNGIIIERQTDIAKMFHISKQAVNQCMKKNHFTLEQVYHYYKKRSEQYD